MDPLYFVVFSPEAMTNYDTTNIPSDLIDMGLIMISSPTIVTYEADDANKKRFALERRIEWPPEEAQRTAIQKFDDYFEAAGLPSPAILDGFLFLIPTLAGPFAIERIFQKFKTLAPDKLSHYKSDASFTLSERVFYMSLKVEEMAE